MTKEARIYFKGGAWNYYVGDCQSADRAYRQRGNSLYSGSFRIMLRKKTEIPS